MVLAGNCGAGGFEGPGFVEVEEAIAVRVPGDEGCGEVVGCVRWSPVVIGDFYRELDVAFVGDGIRPGDRVSWGDEDSRCFAVVDVVCLFDDVDTGLGAEVEVVVGCADGGCWAGGAVWVGDVRWGAGGGGVVLVLAGNCGAGGFEGPGFVEVEEAIAVRVAGDEGCGEVVGCVGRCAVVIGNADVAQRHITGIRDGVRPRDRVADFEVDAWGRAAVDAIRYLHDIDTGARNDVSRRVFGVEGNAGDDITIFIEAGWSDAAGRCAVGVGELRCGAGGFEDPRLGDVENAVVVGIAGDECCEEIIGEISGSAIVIGDARVADRCVSSVGQDVLPQHRSVFSDEDRVDVRIHTVG